jgi:tetratricopeptide (TPR) repeat protein
LNYNFTPAKADLTWSRRFGDCKGKTVLLLALLHELGVEAQPALVNTVAGDGLDERLPMLAAFDHVMVRATIGGKVYWLDGTRLGDRALDDIPIPDVRWALPVQSAGARLEKVEPPPFEKPMFESIERLDASGGYDAPAPAHEEQVYRGDDALTWHVALDSLGAAQAERSLREYWRGEISWIDAKTVSFAYDAAKHEMRLAMDGTAKMDWRENGVVRDFEIDDSSLGFNTSFKREPGPHADAPFAVPYPIHKRWTVVVTLPDKGAGSSLLNAQDLDETIAGRHFTRRSRIEGGAVTMVAEEQTLAPEFPFADGDAAAEGLRRLASTDVFIRGPAATTAATSATSEESVQQAEPTTAAGFSARGVTALNQGRLEAAIADFSQAVRLDPTQGKHYYNRGLARLRAGQYDLALADIDKATSINPKDALAFSARGEIKLINGRYALAKADFDLAAQLAPNDRQLIAHRAAAFERAGFYEDAVRSFDVLVGLSTPQDLAPRVLNGRCWARAEWGRELEQALADCNAALTKMPQAPGILDSRGFVAFRQGRFLAAIDDYDAALRLAPRTASSLFGRGLARMAAGQGAAGAADIAAARAIDPGVEGQFAKYGVKPRVASAP